MIGKTNKQFLFETDLNWITGTTGIISAKHAGEKITVDMPAAFGGTGLAWSPEELFLASISSCFQMTYLAYAKSLHFEITHFDCSIIGQVEIIDGKYKFTNINVYPQIFIANEATRDKANMALEKTHHHCLVTNSVNAMVYYHSKILIADLKHDLL